MKTLLAAVLISVAAPAMAAPALEVTPTDVTGVTFSFYTDDEVGERREDG